MEKYGIKGHGDKSREVRWRLTETTEAEEMGNSFFLFNKPLPPF